mgnify:CR=1 FL=1
MFWLGKGIFPSISDQTVLDVGVSGALLTCRVGWVNGLLH